MVGIALLSNPKSTGNRQMLPRVRAFCASQPDIFHYEVEHVSQIGRALQTIARVKPSVIVINGGDGTVQSALTEIYHGGHFDGALPPVAVLPNGKTNLIALDLGTHGDPIAALERIQTIVREGVAPHIVERELIALTNGRTGNRPVVGMFLGGAGLADTILYCRNRIYPLGLSNGISHFLAAIAVLISMSFGIRSRFLPPRANPVSISLMRDGKLAGRFALLIVTTLERLLFGQKTAIAGMPGGMKLLAVDNNLGALIRMAFAGALGRVGVKPMSGVHLSRGDEIHIDGANSSVVLDGEIFETSDGHPIILKSTQPVPFLRLAA